MERKVIEIDGESRLRLISTARLREAVMLDLAGDGVTIDDLAELESATNPRLATVGPDLDLDPAELAPAAVSGSTIINAAFCHPRADGNRFNNGRRGAWYGANEVETCVAEVVFHMEREFLAINRWDAEVHYSVLHAKIAGTFVDVGGLAGAHLDSDPIVAYPAGQVLAQALRAEGYDGAVYPSVRRPPHGCVVVFKPRAIVQVQQGAVLRMRWTGAPGPIITRLA